MTHSRVTAQMGPLTTNPFYPFAVNADHRDCSVELGMFWWDNGELCPIQNHPDH